MTARCLHTMDAFHQTGILFFSRDDIEREKMFLRHLKLRILQDDLISQQVESRVVVVLFLRCRANPLLCLLLPRLLHSHPQRHNPPTPCSVYDKSSPCVANAAALRGPLRAVGAPCCTSQTSHFSSSVVVTYLLVFISVTALNLFFLEEKCGLERKVLQEEETQLSCDSAAALHFIKLYSPMLLLRQKSSHLIMQKLFFLPR